MHRAHLRLFLSFSCVLLLALGGLPAAADSGLTFDTDDGGVRLWSRPIDPSSGHGYPETSPTYFGDPDGWICMAEFDGRQYFRLPDAFLGDRSDAYGTSLLFSLKANSVGNPPIADVQPDVILRGGGYSLVYDGIEDPTLEWREDSVALVEASFTHEGSEVPATEDELRRTLAQLNDILIRAEYQVGAEENCLDDVNLAGNRAAVPPANTSSRFNLGADGWTAVKIGAGGGIEATDLVWEDTDGNPAGRICATDPAGGATPYFRAPLNYTNGFKRAGGSFLGFDARARPEGAPLTGPEDLILLGDAEMLTYNGHTPDIDWRSHHVPLAAPAWTVDSTGEIATDAEILALLAGGAELLIRAEFIFTEGDVGCLDNVFLIEPGFMMDGFETGDTSGWTSSVGLP